METGHGQTDPEPSSKKGMLSSRSSRLSSPPTNTLSVHSLTSGFLIHLTGGATEAQRRDQTVKCGRTLLGLSQRSPETQEALLSPPHTHTGDTPRVAHRAPRSTWAISRALMTAAKLNMLPIVPRSSAASWIVLCSSAARSSAEPVQPRMSTASMMDMVWNLWERSGQRGSDTRRGPGIGLKGPRPKAE